MSLLREGGAPIEPNMSSSCTKWQDCADKRSTGLQEPPALSLDERGMIHDCSKSCERFFGYERTDLVKHHVSSLFPQLTGVALVQKGQFNPLLNFICRCGQLFQAQNRQGETFPCNLIFVPLENNGRRILRMIVSPSRVANS